MKWGIAIFAICLIFTGFLKYERVQPTLQTISVMESGVEQTMDFWRFEEHVNFYRTFQADGHYIDVPKESEAGLSIEIYGIKQED
jgi:hypothetical protein